MATDNPTPAAQTPAPSPAPGTVTTDQLAAAFSAALAANAPREKKTIANRKVFNPLNPENKPRKFKVPYYQNFHRISEDEVTDSEYALLPKLKPGQFVSDGSEGYLIEVVEVKRGTHMGIHLRYNNAKNDQRMQLMGIVPTLEAMCRRCIREAEDQRKSAAAQRRAEDKAWRETGNDADDADDDDNEE